MSRLLHISCRPRRLHQRICAFQRLERSLASSNKHFLLGSRFQNPAPSVPRWYADNPDIGFVPLQSFQNADIICHKSSRPGQDYVNVRAGSNITLTCG